MCLQPLGSSGDSASRTMLLGSNTLRVLRPERVIATRSGIPARTMLRSAVRRRTSTKIGLRPAALPAFDHALRKSPIGSPLRWNTNGQSSGVWRELTAPTEAAESYIPVTDDVVLRRLEAPARRVAST